MLQCPDCGSNWVTVCGCPRSDRVCANGHRWNYCTVHEVFAANEIYHDEVDDQCTCRPISKDHCIAFVSTGRVRNEDVSMYRGDLIAEIKEKNKVTVYHQYFEYPEELRVVDDRTFYVQETDSRQMVMHHVEHRLIAEMTDHTKPGLPGMSPEKE